VLDAADSTGATVWTASLGQADPRFLPPEITPVVAGGIVWAAADVAGDTRWQAYDAAGNLGCSGSPKVCSPLWSTPTFAGDERPIAVAGNRMYRSVGAWLEVYDANGVEGCSGTPKVCTPLWRAPSGGAEPSAPTVAGGLVFVGSDRHVRAFDAAGQAECAGVPRECAPLWDSLLSDRAGAPVVVSGVVYVPTQAGVVEAFSLRG
jgi:outer membrane protein assembly factor BamB